MREETYAKRKREKERRNLPRLFHPLLTDIVESTSRVFELPLTRLGSLGALRFLSRGVGEQSARGEERIFHTYFHVFVAGTRDRYTRGSDARGYKAFEASARTRDIAAR